MYIYIYICCTYVNLYFNLTLIYVPTHTINLYQPTFLVQAAMDVEDMRRKRLFSRWASSRWTPSRPGDWNKTTRGKGGGHQHPTTFMEAEIFTYINMYYIELCIYI